MIRRSLNQNLQSANVDYIESGYHSEFINVYDIKDVYSKGIHVVTIRGSDKLKKGTYIFVEIVDEAGRAIPIKTIPTTGTFEQTFLPLRRFTFEVTDETKNGSSRMTFVFTLKNGKTVRFERNISINKSIPTTPLRFRGDWTHGEFYEINDVVRYEGSAFVSILPHEANKELNLSTQTYPNDPLVNIEGTSPNDPNGESPQDTRYWNRFVDKGLDGDDGFGAVVEIESSQGFIFEDDGNNDTEFTATLYINGNEVNGEEYRWYVKNQGETSFNLFSTGKSIEINDIRTSKIFRVDVDYNGNTYSASEQVSGFSQIRTLSIDVTDIAMFIKEDGTKVPESIDVRVRKRNISTPVQWYYYDVSGNKVIIDSNTPNITIESEIWISFGREFFGDERRIIIGVETIDEEHFDEQGFFLLKDGESNFYVPMIPFSIDLRATWTGELKSDLNEKAVKISAYKGINKLEYDPNATDVNDLSEYSYLITDIEVRDDENNIISSSDFDYVFSKQSHETDMWDNGAEFKITNIERDIEYAFVYFTVKGYTNDEYPIHVREKVIPVKKEKAEPVYEAFITSTNGIFFEEDSVQETTLETYLRIENELVTPDSYTWFLNDTEISGETNKTLELENILSQKVITCNMEYEGRIFISQIELNGYFNGKLLKLVSSDTTFKMDKSGDIDPEEIEIEAIRTNHERDIEWFFIDFEGNKIKIEDEGGGNTNIEGINFVNELKINLHPEIFKLDRRRKQIEVRTVDDELFDRQSYYLAIEGDDGITLEISNSNHTFASNWLGEVYQASFDAYESILRVLWGTDTLQYDPTASSFEDLSPKSYFITSVNITPTDALYSGFNYELHDSTNVRFTVSDFNKNIDEALVTFTVGVKLRNELFIFDLEEELEEHFKEDIRTFTKTLSFSKSSEPEPNRRIRIVSEGNIFVRDNQGNIEPTSITVELERRSVYEDALWSIGNRNATTTGTPADWDTFEVFPSDITNENEVETLLVEVTEPDSIEGSTGTFTDRASFAILDEGSDGITLFTEPRVITIPTDSDGNPFESVNEISDLRVFQGEINITNRYVWQLGSATTSSNASISANNERARITITGISDDLERVQFEGIPKAEYDDELSVITDSVIIYKSLQGFRGFTGLSLVFRGLWNSQTQYGTTENSTDVVFIGDDGNETFYYVNPEIEGTVDVGVEPDTPDGENIWLPFQTQYESIATDLALFKDVTIRRSLTLGDADLEANVGWGAQGYLRSLGGFNYNDYVSGGYTEDIPSGFITYDQDTIENSSSYRRFFELSPEGLDVWRGKVGGWDITPTTIRNVDSGGGIELNAENKTFKFLYDDQDPNNYSMKIGPDASFPSAQTPLKTGSLSGGEVGGSVDTFTTSNFDISDWGDMVIDINFTVTRSVSTFYGHIFLEARDGTDDWEVIRSAFVILLGSSPRAFRVVQNFNKYTQIRVRAKRFSEWINGHAIATVSTIQFQQHNQVTIFNQQGIFTRVTPNETIPLSGDLSGLSTGFFDEQFGSFMRIQTNEDPEDALTQDDVLKFKSGNNVQLSYNASEKELEIGSNISSLWFLSANQSSPIEVHPNDTVDFNGIGGIEVTRDGHTISIENTTTFTDRYLSGVSYIGDVGDDLELEFTIDNGTNFSYNLDTDSYLVSYLNNHFNNYSHPSFGSGNQPSNPLDGNTVISQILVNNTGHVTGVNTKFIPAYSHWNLSVPSMSLFEQISDSDEVIFEGGDDIEVVTSQSGGATTLTFNYTGGFTDRYLSGVSYIGDVGDDLTLRFTVQNGDDIDYPLDTDSYLVSYLNNHFNNYSHPAYNPSTEKYPATDLPETDIISRIDVENGHVVGIGTRIASFDNYEGWRVRTGGQNYITVGSNQHLEFVGGTNVTLDYDPLAHAGTPNDPYKITINASVSSPNYYLNSVVYQPLNDRIVFEMQNTSNVFFNLSNSGFDNRYASPSHTHSANDINSGTLHLNRIPTIPNSKLDNSTISGRSLGTNLQNLSTGTGLSGSNYNGSSSTTWQVNFGTSAGTVSEGNHGHSQLHDSGLSGHSWANQNLRTTDIPKFDRLRLGTTSSFGDWSLIIGSDNGGIWVGGGNDLNMDGGNITFSDNGGLILPNNWAT